LPYNRINLNKDSMRKIHFAILISIVSIFTSCSKDEPKAPLEIPTKYDGSTYADNISLQSEVLAKLTAQVDEAKKGRTPGTVVTLANLQSLYTTGNPSLKTVSTTYFAGKMEGINGYMDELAKASGVTYTPGTPNGQGGVYEAYLFDENGVEFEQLIEKGQFGAVLYKHASDLLSVTLTIETVDQLVAIFGASPAFPNSGTASSLVTPDKFLANYAARRDKNDGNGFYTQMETAFIKLQAALKAGDNYKQEQQEAIGVIKLTWEKVNAATVIHYCHAATATLSATSVNDVQKSSALHALGEGIGFIHGWKTIPASFKKITDAEIDEVLVLLNAPASGTPTVYKFATDAVAELPKLQQVITKLKNIYGFTDQEIEDFKKNWVSFQGR
jgi:hypothetical protein